MNNHIYKLFVISAVLISISCDKPKFDIEQARLEILELHHIQRQYHFEKQSEDFAKLLSENHISVNKGKISQPTFEENKTRFGKYFESVEFEKWDDIDEPIIRFSDDGTLAYTIVTKDVIVNYQTSDSTLVKEQTIFTWVAIYKKYNDQWKVDCVASTNLPSHVIH